MKILICSDGSVPAARAVGLGAAIASACHADVTLLGVMERHGDDSNILEALRQAQQSLENKKIHAELVTKSGDPVEEILRKTEETKYDMVVIGAPCKDTSGAFWRSSKTYRIIKSITPPVLAVMGEQTSLARILICSGGREHAKNAVLLAGEIARGLSASVTLFHVLPPPPAMYAQIYRIEMNPATILASNTELGRNLREQKAALEGLGLAAEIRFRQGPVIAEIFREIREGSYDLVVTGSSLSDLGLRTYILGNVTREIVNHSSGSVLVVRSDLGVEPAPGIFKWIERVTRF